MRFSRALIVVPAELQITSRRRFSASRPRGRRRRVFRVLTFQRSSSVAGRAVALVVESSSSRSPENRRRLKAAVAHLLTHDEWPAAVSASAAS